MAELLTVRSLVHASAGSTAGCAAITLFYPLNLVRTRLQLAESGKSKGAFTVMNEIVSTEGLAALYVGLWSNVVCLGCSNFVYFYLYNGFRAVLLSRKRQTGQAQLIPAHMNLMVAAAAGILNVLITNPLWVASMRIMTHRRTQSKVQRQEFRGVLDAVHRIGTREGVAALWNGCGASLLLVSNPVVQFVVYEWVKKVMARLRGYRIRTIEFFLMGAFAKATATVFTYPIQLAQSRLRSKEHQDEKGYRGVMDLLITTVQRDGLLGLFRGMEAKLWQTVLAAAFHFLAYEKMIQGVQDVFLRQRGEIKSPHSS